MKSKPITILNYLMLTAFFVSVIVQYNDPDPLLWMAIYGIAVVICLLAALGKLNWSVSAVMAFAALGGALFLAPRVIGKVAFLEIFESMQMKTIAVEYAREMGGLLIIAVWMVVLTIHTRRQQKVS